MKLPILFVCEDNRFAVHTPTSKRQGFQSISDIVSKFNCHVLGEKTTDVEIIYKLACQAIELINSTLAPCFLYLKYYRYLEHVGVNKDFDAGYRPKDEFEEWHRVDPIKLQREKLKSLGYPEEKIKSIEIEIDNQINSSIAQAKKAPFSEGCQLYKGVFDEED
jgi:pyruvate dehydrogenase E1 component alpha subunit